ncbi:MAG: GNAT family N-acetyltransferase [Planctomycetota bacterium]|nr:MAG: GNAT family N-acetyltransferase [Planctomycetota bacterium]
MFQIFEITAAHDAAIAEIITTVGIEFGAVGEGFGPADAEVSAMSENYRNVNRSLYLVAEIDGEIVGGGGVAAFVGRPQTSELRKLFLLPKARGLGIGETISVQCLEYAKNHGYTECYLETMGGMKAAIALYQKLGFNILQEPLPGSAHCGCEIWMLNRWG